LWGPSDRLRENDRDCAEGFEPCPSRSS